MSRVTRYTSKIKSRRRVNRRRIKTVGRNTIGHKRYGRNTKKRGSFKKNTRQKKGGDWNLGLGRRIKNVTTYFGTPSDIRNQAADIVRNNKNGEVMFNEYSQEGRKSQLDDPRNSINPWNKTHFIDPIEQKMLEELVQSKMKIFINKYAQQRQSGCVKNIDEKYLSNFQVNNVSNNGTFSSEEKIDNYFNNLDEQLQICMDSSQLIERIICIISKFQDIINIKDATAAEIARSASTGVISDAVKKHINDKNLSSIDKAGIQQYISTLNVYLKKLESINMDESERNKCRNFLDTINNTIFKNNNTCKIP
jgi:hypothetical protein